MVENDTMDGSDTTDPDATEFPEPSATDFATDPILFQHLNSTGFLKIASSRTNHASFNLEVTNPLAIYRGTDAWPELIRFFGAPDATLRSRLLLKASPDDRASYEQQTALDVQAKFVSGNMSVLIDLNAANRISEPPTQQMQPGQWYEEELVVQSYRDTAETTDLVITVDDTA